MSTSLVTPAIGQIWPGQGGIYAGVLPPRGDQPAYHLVIAAVDVGRFEWGLHGDDAPAQSLVDGQSNTAALIESGGDYPAAKAAAAYVADEHADFYLPAAAELYEAWMNLGDRAWGWHWSSSQRTPGSVLGQYFDVGSQNLMAKYSEFLVRPVRRLPIEA